MAVVKAALSVSHGQAGVEWGFSLNKLIIVANWISLKQRTVVALRTVRDVVNRYEAVDKIPISRQLIHRYRASHAAYSADLASLEQGAENKEREKQADDAAIKDKQKKKAEVKEKQKQAEQLISEASDRLAKAASSNSKSELVAAQALLQSGNTKLKEGGGRIGCCSTAKERKCD